MKKRIFWSAAKFLLPVTGAMMCLAAWPGVAREAPNLPRFASLKSDLVNMREGPSSEHPIKWVYRHVGLPVEILAEYDVWRRVRDSDGEIGWIHVALLSPERTALITGSAAAPVRRGADSESALIAYAEPGATALLHGCGPFACELDFGDIDGWVERAYLWGVFPDEEL